MASHASPFHLALGLGQRRRWEPTNTEAQRQRVANDQPLGLASVHVAERTGAVRNARVQHAAVVRMDMVLGGAVQKHVQVRADVHVARLQGTREREDKRDVLLLLGLFADILKMWRWAGGQTAGERGVGVDVELEEVEEGVGHHSNRAVHLSLDAVMELEGFLRFVALGEGDPFDLMAFGVLDVFTRFAAAICVLGGVRHGRDRAGVITHELRFMHSTLMGAP